jgi:energy-coupling factor transporter ATP-binding protein EcfA2
MAANLAVSEAASIRLERLALKGIGPFEDAVFEIPEPAPGSTGELVLFEGPNGSGKSTLLEAVAVLIGAVAGFVSSDSIVGMSREQSDAMLNAHSSQFFKAVSPLLPPFSDCKRRFHSDAASIEGDVRQGRRSFKLGYKALSAFTRVSPEPDETGFDPVRSALAKAAAGQKQRLPWAAFAYRGPVLPAKLDTQGPGPIKPSPLQGALSFGRVLTGGEHLGQLFINLEFERVQAVAYSADSSGEKKGDMLAVANARQSAIERFKRVFSKVLGRKVTLEFPLGLHAPRVLFDGEDVPIDLLGEGLRRTVSWLADLLVRLELIEWQDPLTSPLDQPFWLLLDEVDQSLHPTLQMCILPALRELFPNARIYATTHSPFVVASAGEGYVFSIRPGKNRRVTGRVEPTKLEHGQSLEWVVEEIFGAPSTFLDRTRSANRVAKFG